MHVSLTKLVLGAKELVLAIVHDITERKQLDAELEKHRTRLEEQVQERTRELALAKEKAESADRLKSAFLAAMSHELRTPLNSILGFTGILLKRIPGELNPEQDKQLGMVRQSARHLLALINDVLDISKIEAGQLRVERQAFDAREATEEVFESVRPTAEAKGLEIELRIETGGNRLVSDRRRYCQILLNLLSNAIKFTDAGSVTLTLSDRADSGIEVAIQDTGIGIDTEDLASIFRPFLQVDRGTTRSHEGTGLGLAISRRLLSLMGGEIWAESALGKGSTFSFFLPRGTESEEE